MGRQALALPLVGALGRRLAMALGRASFLAWQLDPGPIGGLPVGVVTRSGRRSASGNSATGSKGAGVSAGNAHLHLDGLAARPDLPDLALALRARGIYNHLQLRKRSPLTRLQREMLATVVNGYLSGAP